ASSAAGTSTRAETTRRRSGRLLPGGTVAPLAAMEFSDGIEKVILREVGPQPIHEDELRVGRLPKQKVADSFLAAGADDEVGIGHPRGQQITGEQSLVDIVRDQPARLYLGRNAARGKGDLP